MYCGKEIYDFLAKLSEKLVEQIKRAFCSSNCASSSFNHSAGRLGGNKKTWLFHITQTCPCNILQYFTALKNDNFQMKIVDNFLIFAQNIDCGYTLEPPP